MCRYKPGTPVYIDTFAGLLKGKVQTVKGNHDYPDQDLYIDAVVTTRKNRVYKAGEILTFPVTSSLVMPRSEVLLRQRPGALWIIPRRQAEREKKK